MTSTQKQIFLTLLQGGTIAHYGNAGIRLRDNKTNPVQNVNPRSWRRIKYYLKKRKGLWVLSPKEVLKQSKNSWVKKEYKRFKETKNKVLVFK